MVASRREVLVMSLGRVFLAAALLAFGQQRSFAACTDPAAVAAPRAAADQACTSMAMGCSTAKSDGEYVSCVAHQAKAAVKAGTLPKQCKGTVVKCAAKSTCGKPGFVTCCRTTKQGNPACAITPRAARCTAPKHGAACVGSVPSCCDVCAEGACATNATTTTTSASTTHAPSTTTPTATSSTTRPTTTTTTTRPPTTTSTMTRTTITTPTTTRPSGAIQTVFLILMENTDWSSIKGSSSAPYINRTLLPIASHAEQYYNPPNMHPSLPNYLWLEAGTNFGILDDNEPSSNHQSTTSHLVNMLETAGISWKTYQEDEGSGAWDGASCPTGFNYGNRYDVNHNPFAYFTDITNTARCIQHVRPYSEFATDLASNTVPRYNFIVPDLCHDMHENIDCSQSDRIKFGDTWLSTEVPKILASQAYLNNGALFITWDEAASGDGPIGMIVLSPKGKGGGYSNTIAYDHSSTLRTMQEIFNVTTPMLGGAANATDLRDLFVSFP